MKFSMAALCDRATVREGLLHILGAGVTQCRVPLPGAPDLDLALLLTGDDWEDASGQHTLVVRVLEPSGLTAGDATLTWDAANPGADDDDPLPQLPIVVPLRGTLLRQAGRHTVELTLDGEVVHRLLFNVSKADLPGVTTKFG